jgi:hypothetical protein
MFDKYERFTPQERAPFAQELKRRYEDDKESIRSLMRATGRSYGCVHRWLTEAETTFRGRGGDNRSKKRAA